MRELTELEKTLVGGGYGAFGPGHFGGSQVRVPGSHFPGSGNADAYAVAVDVRGSAHDILIPFSQITTNGGQTGAWIYSGSAARGDGLEVVGTLDRVWVGVQNVISPLWNDIDGYFDSSNAYAQTTVGQTPSQHPSPCVANQGEPMPAGVNMQELRRQAFEFGALIGNASIEFFGVIYMHDGRLHQSGTITSYSQGSVVSSIQDLNLPPGSVIVAEIHNHPTGNPRPSNNQDAALNDWVAYDSLRTMNLSALGIRVDANLIMYIATAQGVFEYTRDDRQTSDVNEGGLVTRDGGC